MSTFEASRGLRNQTHFEVIEIDLPVITGTCTIGSSNGFGTPLSCDQPWASEYKTYKFTNTDAPILSGSMFRCVKAINETPVELKAGNGLASRGSLQITFTDFKGQDPNEGAAGVTDDVKAAGTFFGKLAARQIFENKTIRLKLYRCEADGTVDLVNGAQVRYYIANSLKYNPSGDQWVLQCKDAMSVANLSEKVWPAKPTGYLRQNIDANSPAIPVDPDTDYSAAFCVRIGDEFMEIISVTDNLTSTAVLNVKPRGSSPTALVSGVILTTTTAETHSAGDDVFICELSDDETIDSLLTRILTDSDVPSALIPASAWADEVNEWHLNDKINTLHSESESVNTVINRILIGFLMDLWFDSTANLIKLSAISVWKQSTAALTEGKEVSAYSVKKQAQDSLRASRALVLYNKRNLSANDDATSYKQGARYSDNTVITDALFGQHKDKIFDNNFLIGENAAELLTQRYVNRFRYMPYIRTWQTDERFMTYAVGDVVDLFTTADQAFNGSYSGNVRSQIISVKTKYTKSGRTYETKAMTYEAAAESGSERVIDEPLNGIDLHQQAGAPPDAVDITFILDGTYSSGDVAIRAGAFVEGSTITLILINAFDGQATGGRGGAGGTIEWDAESGSWINEPPIGGVAGGTVYDAQGVTTDIYFSGATPSVAYPIADGYIRAPSGGAGGFNANETAEVGGDGGNGGDGRSGGIGGFAGYVIDNSQQTTYANTGVNGTINGTGSGWGVAGANNDAIGGAAGSGVVDSDGTVTFHGSDASRYINGNGDH